MFLSRRFLREDRFWQKEKNEFVPKQDAGVNSEQIFFAERKKTGKVAIGEKIIEVEIADTLKKRRQGLSGREKLKENQGMLFVFPKKDYYSFWMKEMKFPIDIIWINDERIVDIVSRASPDEFQLFKTYESKKPANFVLEINAGFSEIFNIKINDRVKILYEPYGI